MCSTHLYWYRVLPLKCLYAVNVWNKLSNRNNHVDKNAIKYLIGQMIIEDVINLQYSLRVLLFVERNGRTLVPSHIQYNDLLINMKTFCYYYKHFNLSFWNAAWNIYDHRTLKKTECKYSVSQSINNLKDWSVCPTKIPWDNTAEHTHGVLGCPGNSYI